MISPLSSPLLWQTFMNTPCYKVILSMAWKRPPCLNFSCVGFRRAGISWSRRALSRRWDSSKIWHSRRKNSITLIGTRILLRGEELRPHYSALQVLVGEPLLAEGEDWQAALQLRDSARCRILAQLGEPDAAA